MSASLAVNAPVGATGDTLDTLRALRDIGGTLDASEVEALANAVNAGSMNPPSVDPNVTLAYGIHQRLEVGLRVGATHLGAQARVQFLRISPGIYGALGLQLSTSLSTLPISRFNDRIHIESYRRLDFGVPLMLGYSSSVVHLWAGPKLMFSRLSSSGHLCVRETDACADRVTFEGEASVRYVAGQLGLALGRRRFWIALELTVARVRGSGTLRGQHTSGESLFEGRAAGRVVQPAIGLISWF
jgi:hypothetical protein